MATIKGPPIPSSLKKTPTSFEEPVFFPDIRNGF